MTFWGEVLKAVLGRGLLGVWSARGQSGLIGIKMKFQDHQPLISTSLGPVFCGQQFSSGGSLLPVKKDLGMYVSSSRLSGNWELGDSAVWLVYRLNYYQLPSQQLFFVSTSSHFLVIDCFLSFLFFNWNVIALECCVHLWYTIAWISSA